MQILETQFSDIPEIRSMENNIENSQYIIPNSEEEHISLIKDGNVKHLLLTINSRIIGFVILAGLQNANRDIEFRRVVIKEKGKGYGRMAVQKIKKYCFDKLNCKRLWLDVIETNARARYLYQSEGFEEEDILTESVLINNVYHKLIIMSILKNRYKN